MSPEGDEEHSGKQGRKSHLPSQATQMVKVTAQWQCTSLLLSAIAQPEPLALSQRDTLPECFAIVPSPFSDPTPRCLHAEGDVAHTRPEFKDAQRAASAPAKSSIPVTGFKEADLFGFSHHFGPFHEQHLTVTYPIVELHDNDG